MRKLILFLVAGIICCVSQEGGSGATGATKYYMRADGKAANKGAAASLNACAAPSTAMSVKTHNTQSFNPGDTIYLCDNGGIYKENIVAPSSGTKNNPITYTNAAGHNPVCDGSFVISDRTAEGWVHMGGGLYKHEKAYAQVFFEDDVPLPKATTNDCRDGDWYYDVVRKPWIIYYRPRHGTPADHKLSRIWADGLSSQRGLDLADRSNIAVHGLTFDRQGVGIYVGHNVKSNVSLVSNIIIRDNTITRSYWGIWGRSWGDGIVSDVNIYDNVVNYSSYGIGSWTNRTKGTRSAGYNARFVITRNKILNLDSITDTLTWNRAFGAMDEFYGIDHEGISFQDVQDSVISHNLITSKVPVMGKMTPRGIFLYGSHDVTVKMSGNKILYNRLEGGFHEGIYINCYSTIVWPHAGFENNVIAYNVMVGDDDPFTNHNSILISFNEMNPAKGTNYVINNTIYNGDRCGAYGINVAAYSGNWVFKNNIIKAATNFVLGYSKNPVSSNFTIDHNIYAKNTSFFINGLRRKYAEWNAAGYDTVGSKITDPLLNEDGTLTSLSPAIDQGMNLGDKHALALLPQSAWTKSVLLDDQNHYGKKWEIGAYIFVNSKSKNALVYHE